MTVPTTLWAYPWDLLDEGIDAALRRMAERAGATDVAVATVYHAGKFLHPNNPRRKVVFPRSGTLYYRADLSWYGKGAITPPLWPPLNEHDFWPELSQHAGARGLGLTAWVVCLHNSGVGQAHPAATVQNAFGDQIPTDLCAANPDVAAYLTAVTADIAAAGHVDRILLESLEYMPFQHGYHHEVLGVPIGPTVGLLLSLCFCAHCKARAADAGVDADQVRTHVARVVDDHFADPFAGVPRWSWEELRSAADGQLGRYLDVRAGSVANLANAVVAGIRERNGDVRVAALDFGPLYGNGPDGRRWESGADLDVLDALVDELHPTFYFTDPEVHDAKVEQYLELAGDATVVPALRAILPQTAGREDLARQLTPLVGRVAGLSFYNYGFMARQTLDWIGELTSSAAIREVGA